MKYRLAGAIALLIAVMSAAAYVRWSIWSYGADTGIFAQSILNAFHGFSNSVEPGRTHFKTHWSPILATLWPLVALTRSPLSIQIAQTVLVGLTAVPLYGITAAYAGERWAFKISALSLLYPPLLANAFSEFHELAFYPPVALALIWAADRGKWLWFAVFAAAAVTIREDVCVSIIFVGLALAYSAWRSGGPRGRGLLYGEPTQRRETLIAGLALAALSSLVLAAYAFLILPALGRWMPLHFYTYGSAPVSADAAIARLTFVLEVVLPLALLPVFSRWTLLALPALAEILLANDGGVWRMGSHYVLLLVPWVLLGADAALVRYVRAGRIATAQRWWQGALALCVVFLLAFDPMHPLHYLRPSPYEHYANAERAISCLPPNALVATHDEWLTHFAIVHPGVMQFAKTPNRFPRYLLFSEDWQNAHFTGVLLPEIRAAQLSGRYRILCRYGEVVVLSASRFR